MWPPLQCLKRVHNLQSAWVFLVLGCQDVHCIGALFDCWMDFISYLVQVRSTLPSIGATILKK